MSKVKKERRIKIYTKHVYSSGKYIVVPEIRLCGNWLTELGFDKGSQVIILCSQGEIHIKLLPKNNE